MLCKKHLEMRKSEIARQKEKARKSRRDLADTFHPAWGVTELEESLKLAQSKNYCVDYVTESSRHSC